MAVLLTKPLLNTSRLALGYGSVPLYQNLNLKLYEGQFVALLGRNGSGKSTLMRTLANLQPPLAGEVRLYGEPIGQMPPTKRAQYLSLVLTDPIEAPYLKAFELVAMGRQPYTNWWGQLSDSDSAKVREAIALVEGESLQEKRFGTLSDGEKQRILLARALAQDTPLIFLDEPTAHLDLYHQRELFGLLQRLVREQKRSILVATHAVQSAVSLADQIWLLEEGKLHSGLPEDLAQQGILSRIFFDNTPMREGLTDPTLLNPPEQPLKTFRLSGGEAYSRFWVQQALQKYGIACREKAVQTLYIEQKNQEKTTYRLGGQTFERIADLLLELKG